MNPHHPDYNIWHPFSQMKTVRDLPKVVKAEGVWLHTEEGQKIFDAISSWWVNLHGHSHPYIAEKVYQQMRTLEHVIFAGFTHDPAIELCRRLNAYMPSGDWKYFFSDNGSTAVEVALKLAVQYIRQQNGQVPVRIIALEGAYHGDTFGAMSTGERNVFSEPWEDLLFEVVHIPPPGQGEEEKTLNALRDALTEHSIFIYEPLVQGAAGMKMYSSEALEKMLHTAKKGGALLIADEVMTGFHRTGHFFASNSVSTSPDMLCLSKGLTGGALPMALTVCQRYLYDAFLDDRFEKGFLHGHSFTGNPVGCAAALASLDLLEQTETQQNIQSISELFSASIDRLAQVETLNSVRSTGCIIAAELGRSTDQGYIHPHRDRIYKLALENDVLLRPLGNTIYLLPPYCTTLDLLSETLEKVEFIARKF